MPIRIAPKGLSGHPNDGQGSTLTVAAPMNDTATKPRLSQESITILSVGGALVGTAVALGALILTTTERIEHRIERVVERMLAVENETASLRVDVAELRAGLDGGKAAATGTATDPSASRG